MDRAGLGWVCWCVVISGLMPHVGARLWHYLAFALTACDLRAQGMFFSAHDTSNQAGGARSTKQV